MTDGKYNSTNFPIKWPAYMADHNHPLMTCNPLTYSVEGNISNNWCSTDSPDHFKKSLSETPSDWHYRSKNIEYIVNSSGYRAPEWHSVDWKNSILLIGDSNTFGVGVAEDETISYYLSNMLNKPVINLGYPSASNELILYISSLVFKHFGIPLAVCTMWSGTDRFRIFGKSSPSDVGPWVTTEDKDVIWENVNLTSLYKLSSLNEEMLLGKNYFTGLIANNMWQGRCKLITGSYFEHSAYYTRSDFYVKNDGAARDRLHPGKESHKLTALEIIKVFEK